MNRKEALLLAFTAVCLTIIAIFSIYRFTENTKTALEHGLVRYTFDGWKLPQN